MAADVLEWLTRMLLCAIVLLPCACASRQRAVERASGAEDRIRKIIIEGNEVLDDEEIEAHLYLEETRWLPVPDRQYLFEGFLDVDRDRIEQLYAAHGYYDAKVSDVDVIERKRSRRGKVVDLRFVVDEGLPTQVRSLRFRWPSGPPAGPADRRATPEQIQRHCGQAIGHTFDVEALHEAEATMRTALRNRGYAFATVKGHARVDRVARTAEVEFELVAGPFLRLGRVELEGLVTVPEHAVRVELEPYLGKPYSPRRLQRMEDAVYAMDVFRAVTVTVADEPRGDVVDVRIVVEESQPQQVKLGVGLGLQPNRWEQYGAVRYSHANVAKTLTRVDLQLKAGYAELPTLFRPREHGPIVELEPSVRKKGLLEDQLVWTLDPTFELGIWEGYKFYSPSNRMGVSRFFTRIVETGLSHTLRFVDFFDVSPVLDASHSILGLDFRDPYLVSFIEMQLTLHLTDRLVDPNNGAIVKTTYDLAGGIFGGQYDFHKVTPEIRGYWTPLRRRLQLAARAQLGFIVPFGDEPGAPFDLQYYLGGANTVRGWGLRRLSPSVSECDPQTDGCERIPVGGYTSLLGNVEVRVRAWRELWVMGFFDMGDVQADVATFHPSLWNYSVGPALRYDSPIGTFRLDLGVRVNDPYAYPNEPRWALHFGLGEMF
jgi:outer membrane protein assembly factor BamA